MPLFEFLFPQVSINLQFSINYKTKICKANKPQTDICINICSNSFQNV